MQIYIIEAVLLVFLIFNYLFYLFNQGYFKCGNYLQRVQLLRRAFVFNDGRSGRGLYGSCYRRYFYNLFCRLVEENRQVV